MECDERDMLSPGSIRAERSVALGLTRNMRGWEVDAAREAKDGDKASAVRLEGVQERDADRLRSRCSRLEELRLIAIPAGRQPIEEERATRGWERRPCDLVCTVRHNV